MGTQTPKPNPQTLPKAILFDMDDTVLEYDTVGDGVWRPVCNEYAPKADGLDPEALLDSIRQERVWFWSDPDRHRRGRLDLELARREVVGGALRRLGIVAPQLVSEMGEDYSSRREEAVRPFPGALDTLDRLRALGVRLALVTNGNGEWQRRKIERHGLAPFFDHIQIEGEFGAGKPDDRVYLHALDRLRSKPYEAWMVGDNLEWEVEAPQRLGMLGIWVDNSGAGLPEDTTVRPDRIIRALPELVAGI